MWYIFIWMLWCGHACVCVYSHIHLCVAHMLCTCVEAWDWCVSWPLFIDQIKESIWSSHGWLASSLSGFCLCLSHTGVIGGCHAHTGFLWVLEIWSLVCTIAQYLLPNISFWLSFIFLKAMSRGEISCYAVQAGFQRLGSHNPWVPTTMPSFVLACLLRLVFLLVPGLQGCQD